MKKIIIFIIILLAFLFFLSCTVNDFTGLIRVENHTDADLKNVYIGTTLITNLVSPGNYVDYWYSWKIAGEISAENIDVVDVQKDIEFTLKPGYWVFITAHIFDDGNKERKEIQISVNKQGSEQDDDWREDDD